MTGREPEPEPEPEPGPDRDRIRRIVDKWLPLAGWQRDRLALLLHPGARGGGDDEPE